MASSIVSAVFRKVLIRAACFPTVARFTGHDRRPHASSLQPNVRNADIDENRGLVGHDLQADLVHGLVAGQRLPSVGPALGLEHRRWSDLAGLVAVNTIDLAGRIASDVGHQTIYRWRARELERDRAALFANAESQQQRSRVLHGGHVLIADGKIADYYRRDFEQKVFDSFKRRQQPVRQPAGRQPRSTGSRFQPQPDPVSSAVKNSMLARAGGKAS